MFKKLDRLIQAAMVAGDSLSIIISYWLAFQLRFDFHAPWEEMVLFYETVLLILVVRLAVFRQFNLYRGLWRYASMTDFTALVKAAAASQLLVVALVLFTEHAHFPRSVLIIDPILVLFFTAAMRFALRAAWEMRQKNLDYGIIPKALIFGAGDLGESILREMLKEQRPSRRVVGFIDDDKTKWHHHIHGIPVLGGRQALPKFIEKHSVSEVIVAVAYSRGQMVSDLIAICSELKRKIDFKTVPTISESLAAGRKPGGLRKIEPADLLNRKAVNIDMPGIKTILEGKTVLVTGAGGTIGAEFCRQALGFAPGKLLMVENHNTSLFYIDREISASSGNCRVLPLCGDVTDKPFIRNVFEKHRPHVVFHAAAHKHVPLMEANPQEAVRNNTLGTHILAEAAVEFGAERFLFISTDKAVRSSSVMGASKRLGEMVVRAAAGLGTTRFMSVRFGNVLGSSGSVLRIFQEQIASGGPLTVTHKDATRYFMTTQEAIQLILQACFMGKGGEIFVLNMGTPVKVSDLAKNLILLNGLEPGKDIAIKFTGMRPGEKLHEELFRPNDIRKDTGHQDIFMAVPEESDISLVRGQMAELERLCALAGPEPLLAKIKELIPAYSGWPRA